MERALKERCCTKKASFVLCDPGVYLEADSFQHSSADVLSVNNNKLKGLNRVKILEEEMSRNFQL